MAGGNLKLCAGLEAGIERATHAMGQQRIDIMRLISIVEDAGYVEVEEEYRDNVAACLTNLTIETVGTEEEAAEGLKAALGMEVDGYSEGEFEGEEGGEGTQGELGDLEFLTQLSDLSGTTLVDAYNGFNELIHLAMLWNVRHHCPAGARFAFD